MSYYGLDAKFVPWVTWPTAATRSRRRSSFKATVGQSVALLKRELQMLRAQHVIIQLQCEPDQIRLDGYPRADCKAGDGVIVTFDSPYGPLSYPCDTFIGWWNNLRAIALALEALRKVDRYGVTKRGEQYTGWKKLGSGGTTLQPAMSFEEACAFVAHAAGNPARSAFARSPQEFTELYRQAAKRLHPDVGGDVESFQRLQEAKRVMDLGFKAPN